jgi:23S rRNA (adenine1618-N6)-methyltransferase
MKNKIIAEKTSFHANNIHRFGYDFEHLISISPDLKQYVYTNEHETITIDFSLPAAVKALNKALLIANYKIEYWDIPSGYLCPPIPSRVDYIHYIADLLAETNNKIIPKSETVTGLDVGLGANCIYPILGNSVYGWSFVGTDIDEVAIQNSKKIIENNPKLMDAISLQLQVEPRFIFKNIILPEDRFSFVICNPPFHNSKENAAKSALRKVNNLHEIRTKTPILNFGGQQSELWCEGGEFGFISQMIYESARYPMQVLWFTTLVSKKENLPSLYKILGKVMPVAIKTIDMAHGQKTSRILAWTFQTEKQANEWKF